ncbi:PP2C family protein-serine/threonine phosphatase [Occallatibacter savannae]|uniref:PP2C family protein-serine/threonine phosphatase n=1 Tax=Occallatibacter savannae TaxID=1002691 RepID=UPI000D694A48|nr:fused response regulator/phosphatase [Occallatibacter savannae]
MCDDCGMSPMYDKEPSPLVVVVDDEPSVIRSLTGFLERAGLRTATAGSCSTALQLIRSKRPDLILMDVGLPDGSGLDLCRLLQTEGTTSRTPILFISAHDDPSIKVRGFEAGGLDFITKPIVGVEVIARVRTHLRLRQAYDRLSELHAERLHNLASAQQTLMPALKDDHPTRFFASIRQALTAGGDFYDVIPTGPEVVDYLVADASGHDLAASLWTASLKALTAEFATPLNTPGDIVHALNSSLHHFMPSGAFFTLTYARLNHRTRRLSLVSAGQPPAIVIHATEEKPLILRVEGDVLGAFPDAVFGNIETTLQPSDRLWLYTDGLIENGCTHDLGLSRLISACISRKDMPLAMAVPSVVDDLIGDRSANDDLLLLGVDV